MLLKNAMERSILNYSIRISIIKQKLSNKIDINKLIRRQRTGYMTS